MNTTKEKAERVIKILKAAYREETYARVGEGWEQNVMTHVFQASQPGNRFLALFQELVWRLAPVACPLILGMSYLMLRLQAARMAFDMGELLSGIEGTLFAHLFGM